MKLLSLFCALLIGTALYANDGSFYASGNTIIPLQETDVELKKEVLSMKRDGDYMQVNIYFEFYNPGPAKELIVGFVTPPAGGDVTEEEMSHPQIENFLVQVDGELRSFDVMRVEESGFQLKDDEIRANDFIYLFPIEFESGLTMVNHSYRIRASTGVSEEFATSYRFTTAKQWANGGADEFEMIIDMGEDVLFVLDKYFLSDKAEIKLAGVGSSFIKTLGYGYSDDLPAEVFYIKSGTLRIKQQDFRPDFDLYLWIPSEYLISDFWSIDRSSIQVPYQCVWSYEMEDFCDLAEYSDDELCYLRNYLFAKHGYKFSNQLLFDYFSQFVWYMPDPTVTSSEDILTREEQDLLSKIQEEEEKRY